MATAQTRPKYWKSVLLDERDQEKFDALDGAARFLRTRHELGLNELYRRYKELNHAWCRHNPYPTDEQFEQMAVERWGA